MVDLVGPCACRAEVRQEVPDFLWGSRDGVPDLRAEAAVLASQNDDDFWDALGA